MDENGLFKVVLLKTIKLYFRHSLSSDIKKTDWLATTEDDNS